MQRYLARELECPLAALFLPGVAAVPSVRRALPAGDWLQPLWVVGLSQQAVVSYAPTLEEAVRAATRDLPSAGALWAPRWHGQLLAEVRKRWPTAELRLGLLRYCEHPSAPGVEHLLPSVQRIEPGTAGAGPLLARLDGPVFGIRDDAGRVVSWAGLKLKAPDVWELAVATETSYRGRGFARACVYTAAQHALAQGRLPIYLHDMDNRPSARVADATGFILHARTMHIDLPPGSTL